MIYLLESVVNICTNDYASLWNIVGFVINLIKIGVPILLIVIGMIDFAKAVITNKEDIQKKVMKTIGKRFLYAAGVFASVWIVTFSLDLAANTVGKNNDSYKYNESSWKECWRLITEGSTDGDGGNESSDESDKEYCFYCRDPEAVVWASSAPSCKSGYQYIKEITKKNLCNIGDVAKYIEGVCFQCISSPGTFYWSKKGIPSNDACSFNVSSPNNYINCGGSSLTYCAAGWKYTNSDEEGCFKRSCYFCKDKYYWADYSSASGCEKKTQYTDKQSCKAANNACYLCSGGSSHGEYKWGDYSSARDCNPARSYTTKEECEKHNN